MLKVFVWGVCCLTLASSCNSPTDELIAKTRSNFSDFEASLIKSDTIMSSRLNELASELADTGHLRLSQSEHFIFKNLSDSVEFFREKNSYNKFILKLRVWLQMDEANLETTDFQELEEAITSEINYLDEYLWSNRESLSEEEIRKINELIGKYQLERWKDVYDEIRNKTTDYLQRANSMVQKLKEDL